MNLIREIRPNIMLFVHDEGREQRRACVRENGPDCRDCTNLRIDDFEDKRNNKLIPTAMQIRPASAPNIKRPIVIPGTISDCHGARGGS